MPHRFFGSLDAVALYGMLVEFRPKRMIEVGSGDSTKFARRAIRDHGLPTHLTSIDPQPRASIDQICDRVMRRPVEEVDPTVFEELQAGDFLFIDSSHRTFMNSDVAILFMNLLPPLRDGVVVHLHDIFWPFDYPPEWNDRYYSEQYLLGAYLLNSGGATRKVLLPDAFIVHDLTLVDSCRTLLHIPGIRCPASATWPFGIGGRSFWMQTSEGSKRPAVV
jgi:methyltransferase family protein